MNKEPHLPNSRQQLITSEGACAKAGAALDVTTLNVTLTCGKQGVTQLNSIIYIRLFHELPVV